MLVASGSQWTLGPARPPKVPRAGSYREFSVSVLGPRRVRAFQRHPVDGPTDVREYARELARRRGLQWLALPATLHTRACPCASVSSASRPCGRRSLAVWPLDSRRMAFPHFTRLGWEIRARGRMVSNLTPVRTLQPVTGALGGDSGGLAAAVVPIGLCLSPCLPLPLGAVPAFEPRRQGGRECAVRLVDVCGLGSGGGRTGSGSTPSP